MYDRQTTWQGYIQTPAVGFCGRHAFNKSQKQSLIYDLETYLLLYGGCGEVITRCRRRDLLRQICNKNKHDILIYYKIARASSRNSVLRPSYAILFV